MVPLPWDQDQQPTEAFHKSKFVRMYLESEWRGSEMSLLEFLRRSGHTGKIHHRLEKRHKTEAPEQPIQTWIQSCKTHGEVMVANIMYSRTNDLYYAQWLLLNVPFRNLEELWDDRALRVPHTLRNYALCLLKRPGFWTHANRIKGQLELEAGRKSR